ncbi:zincin, partial [Ramicandelaber brevisporus]
SIGCPTSRKVLYMGVAADCTFVTAVNTPIEARKFILETWNTVSAIYEKQFNIQLGIIEIAVQDMVCPSANNNANGLMNWNQECSASYSIESRLSDFSKWRGNKGTQSDSAGLWHLMTRCASGPEIGIAWLNTLCKSETSQQPGANGGTTYVSGTGVSAMSRDPWRVVAHEIGHNFGAQHDCTADTCPCAPGSSCNCCPCSDKCDCGGKYLMNPASGLPASQFSQCSSKQICSTITVAGARCLKNPGDRRLIETGICGNGIKEAGEDCDCGLPDQCKNPDCCDPNTCKFKPGAQCSDDNDMCCDKCKIRPKGTVCRAKLSECDVAETCDGVSASCPDDSHVLDGTPCTGGKNTAANDIGLACASGMCTSRDSQCAARGTGMGIIGACSVPVSGDLCQLLCESPGSSSSCTVFSGSFVDGTPCALNAKCKGGSCTGDNWFWHFLVLWRQNLVISIPVTCVVAILLL